MVALRASLGGLIREARVAARMSPEKAARFIGVARNTWVRWEEGKTSIPVELLPRIAEVVGVCPVDLVAHAAQIPRYAEAA